MKADSFRAVIDIGQGAIKAIFYLTGGACVAVLSTLVSAGITPDKIRWALLLFAMGSAGSVLTWGGSYVSQCFFHTQTAAIEEGLVYQAKEAGSVGLIFQLACCVIWFVSFCFFVGGCFALYVAFG